MKFPKNNLAAIFCGTLLGATVYLGIAMGEGRAPWAVSDFAIYAGLASVLLSWFSFNKDSKHGVLGAVAGIIFTAAALPIFFIYLFAMGLPGNESPTREQLFSFLIAPILVSVLFVARRPQSASAIAIAFLFSFLFCLTAIQVVTRLYIQSAIQRVQADGGCVLVRRSENLGLEWQKIKSIRDISFSLVIGHVSDRISFATPSGSTEWKFAQMKEFPSTIIFSECNK